jgi:hypothetical protein
MGKIGEGKIKYGYYPADHPYEQLEQLIVGRL